MTMGLAFWILMLIWFIFGAWGVWNAPAWPHVGGSLLLFVLLLLLGWHAFGPPIKG